MFYDLSGFTNVTIPDSVTSIGTYAFYSCCGLTSITCLPPTLETEVFYNTNTCPIKVPSASVEAYKAAENWSGYSGRISAIK